MTCHVFYCASCNMLIHVYLPHVLQLGRHAKGGGSQECTNCGACKESVENVLFECASYDSQRQIFFDYNEANPYSGRIPSFNYISIFDKSVFCLGEKPCVLINDECSSWYNRV